MIAHLRSTTGYLDGKEDLWIITQYPAVQREECGQTFRQWQIERIQTEGGKGGSQDDGRLQLLAGK